MDDTYSATTTPCRSRLGNEVVAQINS